MLMSAVGWEQSVNIITVLGITGHLGGMGVYVFTYVFTR